MSTMPAVEEGYLPSPLCPTADDRDRFVDMNRRLMPTQNLLLATMLALVLPSVAAVYRPLPAVLGLIAIAVQGVLYRLSERFRRPELPFALSIVIALVGITVAIVLQGREHRGDLIILTWPTVMAYSRFPTRVAHCFTALTVALLVVAQSAFDPAALVAKPLAAAVSVTGLIAVAVFAAAVRDSDARHRREAILDELTGLLNRTALRSRVAELQAQSRLAGGAVGLILADLDHFKSVNDRHGHHKGDQVLVEVAARLRDCLRAYDSIYRIGGEELAVLVPGATREELSELSERLCEAVHDAPVADLDVTISVGAARSQPGTELLWDELFRAADRALYRAKAAGRDRVALG